MLRHRLRDGVPGSNRRMASAGSPSSSADEPAIISISPLATQYKVGGSSGRGPRSSASLAVLVLRWFLDDARMTGLARDNGISSSTAYDYRYEGIAVLAARKPTLHGALLAAKAAGHTHVIVDGTLIHTDRIHAPGPTPVVERQAPPPWREHPGGVRTGRVVLLHQENGRTT